MSNFHLLLSDKLHDKYRLYTAKSIVSARAVHNLMVAHLEYLLDKAWAEHRGYEYKPPTESSDSKQQDTDSSSKGDIALIKLSQTEAFVREPNAARQVTSYTEGVENPIEMEGGDVLIPK